MPWLLVTFKHWQAGRFARWPALLLPFFLILLSINPVDASKKKRDLTQLEVSQIWIGISEDEEYVFRLSLAADGRGFGAYSFLNNEPQIFRISAWKYEPPAIYITIEPVEPHSLVAQHLNGKLSGFKMQLRMSGEGWERALLFRREEDLLGRWREIRDSMNQFRVQE